MGSLYCSTSLNKKSVSTRSCESRIFFIFLVQFSFLHVRVPAIGSFSHVMHPMSSLFSVSKTEMIKVRPRYCILLSCDDLALCIVTIVQAVPPSESLRDCKGSCDDPTLLRIPDQLLVDSFITSEEEVLMRDENEIPDIDGIEEMREDLKLSARAESKVVLSYLIQSFHNWWVKFSGSWPRTLKG